MAASFDEELLQAHVELWNLTLSYLKSMALDCAVKLRIPDAMHRLGGGASMPDLVAAVPMPKSRRTHLPRLMRFLAAIGVFTVDASAAAAGEEPGVAAYRLTAVSRLLVDDDDGEGADGRASLSPFVLSQTTKYHLAAAMHLSDWFTGAGDGAAAGVEMLPFKVAHGTDLWGVMADDAEMNDVFSAGMGSDSRLVMKFVVTKCSDVFDGVSMLLDVGGGTGTATRAIAKAFPHVKCSVLDLPYVIDSIPADGVVEYIAGDMMSFIPPTDAVLLKVQ